MNGSNGKGPLRPFIHQIDDESTAGKKVVNVDSRRLINGQNTGTNRAFSTVYASAAPGSKYKDMHQMPSGRVVAAEGPTKQTWINFSDAKRAQHYVATYSEQHIKSDLKQTFGIAQQAAAVGRMMQERREKRGKADSHSSIKTTMRALEAQKQRGQFKEKPPSLFDNASVKTRSVIAGQRMNSWGDAGPVIRGFDVDKQTTRQILGSAVVEDDKKKTRSNVINVDQSKAANQIGISGRSKEHLFKGITPGSMGSVVFNPKAVSSRFESTAGRVSSLKSFEQQHGLSSTVSVVARLRDTQDTRTAPTTTDVVARRSKLPKAKR